MIVPISAHAAFDKAAQYFGIDIVHVPTGPDGRADVAATEAAITDDTVVIVGSSPSFPHGVIDPIEELSELARARGIGFHTDACLGGFVLPWAEKLGYPVPGVRLPPARASPRCRPTPTSTATRPRAPRWCSTAAWSCATSSTSPPPTGPAGSTARPPSPAAGPGALSAACWAALVSIGEAGLPRRHPARSWRRPTRSRPACGADFPELRHLRRPALRHRLHAASTTPSTSTGCSTP